jgi:DNA repair photolyase
MLDKGIQHSKEWRKPYYRSARFDLSCRCHGGCSYCYNNRMHSTRKAKMKANPKEQIDELDEDWPEDLGDFHD